MSSHVGGKTKMVRRQNNTGYPKLGRDLGQGERKIRENKAVQRISTRKTTYKKNLRSSEKRVNGNDHHKATRPRNLNVPWK